VRFCARTSAGEAASLLRRLHVPLRDVQEILGHSTIEITSDLYTHEMPDSQREAMEQLGRLLSPENGRPGPKCPQGPSSGSPR